MAGFGHDPGHWPDYGGIGDDDIFGRDVFDDEDPNDEYQSFEAHTRDLFEDEDPADDVASLERQPDQVAGNIFHQSWKTHNDQRSTGIWMGDARHSLHRSSLGGLSFHDGHATYSPPGRGDFANIERYESRAETFVQEKPMEQGAGGSVLVREDAKLLSNAELAEDVYGLDPRLSAGPETHGDQYTDVKGKAQPAVIPPPQASPPQTLRYNTLAEAERGAYHRRLIIARNDDWQSIQQHPHPHILRLLAAFDAPYRSTPGDLHAQSPENPAWLRYQSLHAAKAAKILTRHAAQRELSAWLLFGAVLEAHEHGARYTANFGVDNKSCCSARLAAITLALGDYAILRWDLLRGQRIHELAANPGSAVASKLSNWKGNQVRVQRDERNAEEASKAGLQYHQVLGKRRQMSATTVEREEGDEGAGTAMPPRKRSVTGSQVQRRLLSAPLAGGGKAHDDDGGQLDGSSTVADWYDGYHPLVAGEGVITECNTARHNAGGHRDATPAFAQGGGYHKQVPPALSGGGRTTVRGRAQGTPASRGGGDATGFAMAQGHGDGRRDATPAFAQGERDHHQPSPWAPNGGSSTTLFAKTQRGGGGRRDATPAFTQRDSGHQPSLWAPGGGSGTTGFARAQHDDDGLDVDSLFSQGGSDHQLGDGGSTIGYGDGDLDEQD